jgi:quercetin dioxygenase-like cupin family protein
VIDMVKSMKLIWWVARLFALFISPLQAQERKDVTITQLLSTTTTSSGQPIVLPQKDAQIVVSIYDMVPGATLPVHKHPYSRYGYVLSGNLRVTNMETGQVGTYRPGDFFPESVGQWHTGAPSGPSRSSCWSSILSRKAKRPQRCRSARARPMHRAAPTINLPGERREHVSNSASSEAPTNRGRR